MNNFDLEVNERLEVIIGDRVYKTVIVDIQEDSFRINLPVSNGEYLILQEREEIEISSCFGDNGCYMFNSKIISRGTEGNIIYYEISEPYNIKKIQRRNFFRVDVLNEIEYKIITNIDEDDYENVSYNKGLMVDLSGGGLKLKIKNDIKEDDLLLVNMYLNEVEFEVKCDIVRIENTIDKQKLCGLRFIDITPAQIDIIIKELFKIVRKQRANV